MEGHLGGTGVDGRQPTRGRGSKEFILEGIPAPSPSQAQCIGRLVMLETNITTEDCQWSTESCIKGQG